MRQLTVWPFLWFTIGSRNWHEFRVYTVKAITAMNPLFRILLGAMILVLPLSAVQAQGDFQEIGSAIKAGNAKALSTHFDNSVEVTILDKEGAYSRSQAESVVKAFFAKNSPTSFKVMHKGSSGGNSQYAIGSLETSGGSYRTYIYVKQKGDSLLIQEIRFERK
jgi:hypothetical protein